MYVFCIKQVSDDHEAILTHIAKWSVLDSSGEFRVCTGVLHPHGKQIIGDEEDKTSEESVVTLVTQSSLSTLRHLPQLADRWQVCLIFKAYLLELVCI